MQVTMCGIWWSDLEFATGAWWCSLATEETLWFSTESSCWDMRVWLIDMWFTTVAAKDNPSACLQALKPSVHVCSKFGSPGRPQFLNQEALEAQQLSLPNVSLNAHLGHTTLVTATACVGIGATAIRRSFASVVQSASVKSINIRDYHNYSITSTAKLCTSRL